MLLGIKGAGWSANSRRWTHRDTVDYTNCSR